MKNLFCCLLLLYSVKRSLPPLFMFIFPQLIILSKSVVFLLSMIMLSFLMLWKDILVFLLIRKINGGLLLSNLWLTLRPFCAIPTFLLSFSIYIGVPVALPSLVFYALQNLRPLPIRFIVHPSTLCSSRISVSEKIVPLFCSSLIPNALPTSTSHSYQLTALFALFALMNHSPPSAPLFTHPIYPSSCFPTGPFSPITISTLLSSVSCVTFLTFTCIVHTASALVLPPLLPPTGLPMQSSRRLDAGKATPTATTSDRHLLPVKSSIFELPFFCLGVWELCDMQASISPVMFVFVITIQIDSAKG